MMPEPFSFPDTPTVPSDSGSGEPDRLASPVPWAGNASPSLLSRESSWWCGRARLAGREGHSHSHCPRSRRHRGFHQTPGQGR
jgi:hypothetical protein